MTSFLINIIQVSVFRFTCDSPPPFLLAKNVVYQYVHIPFPVYGQ